MSAKDQMLLLEFMGDHNELSRRAGEHVPCRCSICQGVRQQPWWRAARAEAESHFVVVSQFESGRNGVAPEGPGYDLAVSQLVDPTTRVDRSDYDRRTTTIKEDVMAFAEQHRGPWTVREVVRATDRRPDSVRTAIIRLCTSGLLVRCEKGGENAEKERNPMLRLYQLAEQRAEAS